MAHFYNRAISNNPFSPVIKRRAILAGSYANFEYFEDSWQQAEGDVIYDNEFVSEGNQSLKLTAVSGGWARADKYAGTIPGDLYALDVFVDDVDKLEHVEILFTKYDYWDGFLRYLCDGSNFHNGQNTIYFHKNDLTMHGVTTDIMEFSEVTKCRLAVLSKPDQTVNCWFDDFRYYNLLKKNKAIVTFTFDDGRDNQYTYAMKIMREYEWAGTVYVATDSVDKQAYTPAGGGPSFTPLTIEQLREMQAFGWDISSHTKTHANLQELSIAEQEEELGGSRDWLLGNGFTKGANYLATPYGRKNADTVRVARKYYHNLRDASVCIWNSGINVMVQGNKQYGLSFWEYSNQSLSEFHSIVQKTIESNGWLILVFHDVGTYGCLETTFRSYCDYLYQLRNSVEIVPMSRAWEG